MEIIVLVKPVPDFTKLKISRGQGTIFETGKQVLNSYDRVALQLAVDIKKKSPAKIHAISICDMTKTDILRDAYAVGSDVCYQIWEPSVEGNDPYVNTKLLGAAIKKIGNFNLIICGAKSDTGFSGQTGPRVAEYLKIPQMTGVRKIEIENTIAKVQNVAGIEKSMPMPLLITVDLAAATPVIPNALNIMRAFKKEITHWTTADLNLRQEDIGEQGALVKVRGKFLVEA